jgi:hypothetical protein
MWQKVLCCLKTGYIVRNAFFILYKHHRIYLHKWSSYKVIDWCKSTRHSYTCGSSLKCLYAAHGWRHTMNPPQK